MSKPNKIFVEKPFLHFEKHGPITMYDYEQEKEYVFDPEGKNRKNYYSVFWKTTPKCYSNALDVFQELTGKRVAECLSDCPIDYIEMEINCAHMIGIAISVLAFCDTIDDISIDNCRFEVEGIWEDIKYPKDFEYSDPVVPIINHKEEIFDAILKELKNEYIVTSNEKIELRSIRNKINDKSYKGYVVNSVCYFPKDVADEIAKDASYGHIGLDYNERHDIYKYIDYHKDRFENSDNVEYHGIFLRNGDEEIKVYPIGNDWTKWCV